MPDQPRFEVISYSYAVEHRLLPLEPGANDYGWVLIEHVPGNMGSAVIGMDGGEPEDQLLIRDWKWVPEALNALDLEWRKTLWLGHACPSPALYGDDGEMQCNNCFLDFKRMTPRELANGIGSRYAMSKFRVTDEFTCGMCRDKVPATAPFSIKVEGIDHRITVMMCKNCASLCDDAKVVGILPNGW